MALRVGLDRGHAIENGPFEIKLHHDSQSLRQSGIHSDGEIERTDFALLYQPGERRQWFSIPVTGVLNGVVAFGFGAKNPLYFGVVVEEGKKNGNALDNRRAKLRLHAFPVLVEPALDGLELVEPVRVRLRRVEQGPGLERDASLAQRLPQLGRRRRKVAAFLRVVHETESRQILGAIPVDLGRQGYGVAAQDDLLGFENLLFEHRRRNGALVDIEQRDVSVGHFVQKNDELYEVGVGLLPERLLALAEKVI
jgi:hypothetical protein